MRSRFPIEVTIPHLPFSLSPFCYSYHSCKIENSILCRNARLMEACNIKDCLVAAFFELEKGSTGKGETYAHVHGLEEDD
jgi:hypothetical protein